MPSLCVIVPAYNEADTLQSVIREIRSVSRRYHIVVVNDGSIDATGKKALASGVSVIELPFNTGIGSAVQTGLKYAKDNHFSVAIQVDGDGQHPPSEIPKLLKALDKKTDFIIGSRFIKKNKYRGAWNRTLGTKFLSWLIQLTCGKKIYDPTSGFRVYNNRAIDFLVRNYPIDFPEPESIVALLNDQFTIKEVGVHMRERVAGQSSIVSLKAIYLYTAILLGIMLAKLKKKNDYEPARLQ